MHELWASDGTSFGETHSTSMTATLVTKLPALEGWACSLHRALSGACDIDVLHGRRFPYEPVIFFAAQAVILCFEGLWKSFTARRVSGRTGRVRVYFVMIVLGQPMVDSWHSRGLGGGQFTYFQRNKTSSVVGLLR
ncbi:hypothetical protein BDZ89DRAFT_727400 [Hymenopellis radicata]|nr:hypothetical protein BDZ89DRAFT_727400 [Hymenopellis radicata]